MRVKKSHSKTDDNRSSQLESPSYMELRIDLDGKESSLFLRVPTFWDAVQNLWLAALKLSDGKLVTSSGKNSVELQNNFNVNLHEIFMNSKYSDELFAMFKPLEYWEK